MYEWIIALIALIVGFFLGYFFASLKSYKDTDLSAKSALLQSLTTQITEMKAKFDGYEEMREQKEKDIEKFNEEKEKRYKEFMESTKKFFEKQDEVRKEYEEKRDQQMNKFSTVIDAFNRTIHGTKTRGNAGEDILRIYLSEAIKSKIIKTDLRTESGEVEFAWNLGDGKFIPIDAKMPDIINLVDSITDETSQSEKNSVRKVVIDKIKGQIKKIKKYQNQPNTINRAILCVPKGAIDLSPEIIQLGASYGVFVCSYEQVFLIGYILAEEYEKIMDEGDIGELKNTNKKLITLLKEITKLTDTIEKQSKSVLKHNELIRDKLQEGLRF